VGNARADPRPLLVAGVAVAVAVAVAARLATSSKTRARRKERVQRRERALVSGETSERASEEQSVMADGGDANKRDGCTCTGRGYTRVKGLGEQYQLLQLVIRYLPEFPLSARLTTCYRV